MTVSSLLSVDWVDQRLVRIRELFISDVESWERLHPHQYRNQPHYLPIIGSRYSQKRNHYRQNQVTKQRVEEYPEYHSSPLPSSLHHVRCHGREGIHYRNWWNQDYQKENRSWDSSEQTQNCRCLPVTCQLCKEMESRQTIICNRMLTYTTSTHPIQRTNSSPICRRSRSCPRQIQHHLL